MSRIFHETKYLLFFDVSRKERKTKTISVINKSWGSEFAVIEWYGAWRQYCFFPTMEFDTVWNNTCLTDVITVINKLMKEREIEKPKGE